MESHLRATDMQLQQTRWSQSLVIQADLTHISPYDAKVVGFAHVKQKLSELPRGEETDWSDGKKFQWWLYMALPARQKFEGIVNEGIVKVTAMNGKLRVTTQRRVHDVKFTGNKVEVVKRDH